MTACTLTVAAVLVTACASNTAGIAVSDARIGMPTGPNAALYLTATGVADRLVGAATSVAGHVELHESVTDEDGSTVMRPVDGFDLEGDASLVLEPGGGHLMLVDVDRLEVGETVEITLTWQRAGDMVIRAEVVVPAEVIGHDR